MRVLLSGRVRLLGLRLRLWVCLVLRSCSESFMSLGEAKSSEFACITPGGLHCYGRMESTRLL